jgi:hypothetical protein
MRPFVIAALSPTQPPIGLVIPAQGLPPRRRERGSRAFKCAQRGGAVSARMGPNAGRPGSPPSRGRRGNTRPGMT